MNTEKEIQTAAGAVVDEVTRDRQRRLDASGDERDRKRPLDSAGLAISLSLAMVVLTALNLSGYGLWPTVEEPTETERNRALEEELELMGLEIEALAEESGELPESIGELIPPATEGYSYQKLDGSRYRLSLTIDGRTRSVEGRVG